MAWGMTGRLLESERTYSVLILRCLALFLKAASVPVEFQEHHLSEVQNMASEEKLEQVLSSMKENKVAIIGMCAE